jgi:serine/threonine protein kinase
MLFRGNNVALDVAAGLAYLHKYRVVHLDLKSSNILLTGDVEPRAKVSDVGLSKIMPTSQDYLASGGGVGTWHWCSPEIILGQRCTAAADIWSFGVVLASHI